MDNNILCFLEWKNLTIYKYIYAPKGKLLYVEVKYISIKKYERETG